MQKSCQASEPFERWIRMYIIAGMHRSGTSFVSQVLDHLGADFGDPELLFPADKWNQNGYFENIDVIDINNRAILGDKASINFWLEAPESLPARLLNSVRSRKWKYFLFPSIESIRGRMENYEGRVTEFHDTYRGKYVKDPRFCLTIGAWAEKGPIEGAVFPFRNPYAVAGSIQRREGLPRSFGFKYWLYHIRGFIQECPTDTDVFFTDFDAYFDAEQQISEFASIAAYLKVADDDPRVESLSGKLDVKLKTQAVSEEGMNNDINAAYDALKSYHALCMGGKTVKLGDYPQLCAKIMGE